MDDPLYEFYTNEMRKKCVAIRKKKPYNEYMYCPFCNVDIKLKSQQYSLHVQRLSHKMASCFTPNGYKKYKY